MTLFCDIRWCFRRGRFPVDKSLYHVCRLHHPTSLLKAPTLEQFYKEWEDTHPEFEVVAIGCESKIVPEEEEDISFFGFMMPKKTIKNESDEVPDEAVTEESPELAESEEEERIEGEQPRRSPQMLPKRFRARFPGHSHQRRLGRLVS